MASRLLILGWHNVEGTWCFPSAPERGSKGLYEQFRMLQRSGNVVDLGDALTKLANGQSLPPRAVALTFDDGYRDNLSLAVPMLHELGLPATIFLAPGILSGQVQPWWEVLGRAFATSRRASLRWGGVTTPLGDARRSAYDDVCGQLKHLDAPAREAAVTELVAELEPETRPDVSELFMDWDEARELVRHGVTVGSHSLDHAILANETPATQQENLAESRRQLEEQLDVPVDLFAYPNGSPSDFDDATVGAAKDAGYRCGVTTIGGWNSRATPLYELRRYVLFPERGRSGFRPIVKRSVLSLVPSGAGGGG
jgi:peptidoglycan/xylan/chitin deacetylase (PgdA/CDA1 family)